MAAVQAYVRARALLSCMLRVWAVGTRRPRLFLVRLGMGMGTGTGTIARQPMTAYYAPGGTYNQGKSPPSQFGRYWIYACKLTDSGT